MIGLLSDLPAADRRWGLVFELKKILFGWGRCMELLVLRKKGRDSPDGVVRLACSEHKGLSATHGAWFNWFFQKVIYTAILCHRRQDRQEDVVVLAAR